MRPGAALRRGAIALAVLGLTLALTPAPVSGAAPRQFVTRPLDLGASSYRMYDLGVVDYNGDGNLDIYSTRACIA